MQRNGYMDTSQAAVQAIAGYYRGSANVPANWASWTYAPGVAQDKKPIWFVETGDGNGQWLNGANGTPGTGAITVAQKIDDALVEGNVSAYYEFLDTSSDPTEYTLIGTNQLSNPLLSKKYCAFKQFSGFVLPGAQRIDAHFVNTGTPATGGASEYDTGNSVDVSAYLDRQDHTFTTVLLNMTATAEPVTVDIPASLGVTSLSDIRTSNTENFAQLATMGVSGGRVSFTLPAYSVETLTTALPGAVLTWNAGSGSWSAGSNWTAGFAPNGQDVTAVLGTSTTAAATVTLVSCLTDQSCAGTRHAGVARGSRLRCGHWSMHSLATEEAVVCDRAVGQKLGHVTRVAGMFGRDSSRAP